MMRSMMGWTMAAVLASAGVAGAQGLAAGAATTRTPNVEFEMTQIRQLLGTSSSAR